METAIDYKRERERGPKQLQISFQGLFEVSDTTAIFGIWDSLWPPCPSAPASPAVHEILKYSLLYHPHPKMSFIWAIFWDDGGIEGDILEAYLRT